MTYTYVLMDVSEDTYYEITTSCPRPGTTIAFTKMTAT